MPQVGRVDRMAFVRTALMIVALVLAWGAVRAHPVAVLETAPGAVPTGQAAP